MFKIQIAKGLISVKIETGVHISIFYIYTTVFRLIIFKNTIPVILIFSLAYI